MFLCVIFLIPQKNRHHFFQHKHDSRQMTKRGCIRLFTSMNKFLMTQKSMKQAHTLSQPFITITNKLHSGDKVAQHHWQHRYTPPFSTTISKNHFPYALRLLFCLHASFHFGCESRWVAAASWTRGQRVGALPLLGTGHTNKMTTLPCPFPFIQLGLHAYGTILFAFNRGNPI